MMKEKEKEFKCRALTKRIIGVFFDVYNELGYGFLESVYEASMSIALNIADIHTERQVRVPVWFRGHLVGNFRADLLVEREVFVEVKACRTLESTHEVQLLNYLRATEIEVGLLLNFGTQPDFKRLVFDNVRKHPHQ
jgi:GxxExxY protein